LVSCRPGHHENPLTPADKKADKYYDAFEAGAPHKLLQKGKAELRKFAQTTLQELIRLEEEFYRRSNISWVPKSSGLRWLARLDIAFLYDVEARKFQYWVNELERGHSTCLFSKMVHSKTNALAPTFVHFLEQILPRGRP
jgi:hypothetical protein